MGITAVIYEFVGGIWNGETQMTEGDSVRKFEGWQTFLQLFIFYHHKCGVLCVEMETTWNGEVTLNGKWSKFARDLGAFCH